MSRLTRLPLAAAVAATLSAAAAQAQQLEEVVVTAQKRAENLQDVPISVSAMQGDKIQEAAIPNMTALADFVPNLHIATASVNTNIYMRGVGSGNNQAFEQSVGMYIDGVYMGRGRQYRAGFLDVERIEVLRGPQGTLFGRNTVAGAVNITTASATVGDEFTGQVAASVEQNDGEIVEGFLSGSLTDTLGARLAFRYRENEGFVDNTLLQRPEGGVEEMGYRLSLNWVPTDDLEVKFKYSQFDQERTGAVSATKVYLTPEERDAVVPNRSDFARTAYAITDIFYPQLQQESQRDFVTFKDNNYGRSADDGIGISFRPDGSEDSLENAVLDITWELGDHLFTSITGYSGYTYEDDVDVDWLPLQFIGRYDDQSFDQVSQEFRLVSPGGEFFDYTLGAYYDKSTLEFFRRVTIDTNFDGLFPEFLSLVTPGNPPPSLLPQNLLLPLTAGNPASQLLGVYGANQIARNHDYELDTESWALFAQGTFNLSDVLRLTVGVRYTEETKDVVSTQRLGDSNCGLGGIPDTSIAGCEMGYNYWLPLIQATNFNTYNYDYRDGRTTDQVVPSINLQWDATASSMVYVSFSQGFKSGGFTSADDGEPAGYVVGQAPPPGAVFTTPNANFEFDDETVDAFEIGGKHDLLDGALRINWAAFYTEYDNLQTSIFNGLGFGVTNASSSEIQGVEIESQWAAAEGLVLGLNVAWLDATYADFPDGPCTAPQLDADPLCGTPAGSTSNDLSGEKTLYASDWSGSLTFDYERPIGGQLTMFASGEVNYRDDFQSSGDNDPLDMIDSYIKTNLRVGVRTDAMELMLYGRNIFDEVAYQQGFDTPVLAGSHAYFVDEGAVFGARLRYNW
ncbi:MAG: TonB-dependent receptor [Halieaceae bacterium]|jgi:outer membrane receptor protein involved in Fe transport|nr:TonB-dependent receptor [Halieaceae bacterium]